MDSRRNSSFAPSVEKDPMYQSIKQNHTDSKLTNLALSGSETLRLTMGKHAKKMYDLRDLEATKDMNKILDKHKTLSSRGHSIDKIHLPKNHLDAPDFMRVLDDPKYKNVAHKDPNGEPMKMMQIISKTQGWMTVTPKEKNRKRPIEKLKLGDATKVN